MNSWSITTSLACWSLLPESGSPSFCLKLLLVMKLSLVVWTVKTNQDWDWKFLDCQDIIFQTFKNFLTVEMSLLKLTETLNQDHVKNLDLRALAPDLVFETYFLKMSWCPCWNCQDKNSRSRLCQKLRLEGSSFVKTWFFKLFRPIFWNCRNVLVEMSRPTFWNC
jgi:hypothetical protein